MTDSRLVPAMLKEYGDVTRVALCDYLRPREPQRHLYNLVADYPHRGGRMLRPSLCIATARAFGAPLEDAVRSAVALELLHNAFLVHDDIEDDSDERRGRPTLHALHGVPVAVNVGDALTLLGLRALIDNRGTLGPGLTLRILEEAERMARESVEGQAIELGWRRDNAISVVRRRLSRDGAEEDLLVHDDLPQPGRCAHRHAAANATSIASFASASSSAPRFRSKTTC